MANQPPNPTQAQQQLADTLQRMRAGPMSEGEIAFLNDVRAFIEFAIRNGLSFQSAMAYLSHDWNEFAMHGYDFDAVMKKGFLPRVTGFSDAEANAVGSAD